MILSILLKCYTRYTIEKTVSLDSRFLLIALFLRLP
jgi:hypothetical protein